MQVKPLPVYPVLQAQVYDPMVFVQIEVPVAQGPGLAEHSFISVWFFRVDLLSATL